MVKQEDKLQLLREILLIEDREIAHAINERLETISKTLEEKQKLSEKVDPIIDEKLNEFVIKIPDRLGPTITKTLKEQIANSKDEVVEALYPIMGKMIKRYIQNEIKVLSEKINKKVNSAFSLAGLKRKFRAKFSGVKESDLILSEANEALVNEVLVIQKGSGLLLGNFSTTETLDKDMVSGMLTAIKSFVEDAFSGGNQNLEAIEYELYTLHIQNFFSYYIAVVVSGNYTRTFESKIENRLLKLSEQLSPKISKLSKPEVDTILKSFFEAQLSKIGTLQ
ncbi:cell envelope biogenesis protein OmpA [Aureisphaera sp. CAU 1614]|uniref:Cell envelope biogenesis protein OmpA n=1 Tax=Halomarinibacterium sedimenti TaxID=2857106 RepID=A0A9X1K0I6_9FLAO|nr:cell envelope biogenesis protein OmpA [Halomarinibacterium sedimenti]MBW2938491.1 cell envelope biogenesis protein OmpA [Halomarinibacterium sedimenti]